MRCKRRELKNEKPPICYRNCGRLTDRYSSVLLASVGTSCSCSTDRQSDIRGPWTETSHGSISDCRLSSRLLADFCPTRTFPGVPNSQARHLDMRRESKNSRPASLSAVTTCEGNAFLSSSSSLQSRSRRGPSRRSLHHHVRGRQHASRGLQWDGWNRFVAGRASCSVDDQVGDATCQ